MALFNALQAESITFPDLLKKAELEQAQALVELSHFLHLNPETHFQPLQGGLTRARLYSFKQGDETYVLRFLALSPSHSKNMRQNEIKALAIGNSLGIAPPYTFSDQNAVLMVMPFVEGQTWHNPTDTQLSQLGKMIQTLHTFSASYPTRYSFKERLNLHYQKGVKAAIAYPTGFEQEIQNVLNKSCSRPLVPSHGDLNPSNILMSDKGLSLIDWTNATLDDPFADLSFFCALSNLSPQQEMVFLTSYFGRAPTADELQILEEEKAKVYLLTATIWLRFSETAEELKLPLSERIAALDKELHSPSLKSAQDYLDSGIVVDLNTAPKTEVRSYALSFFRAYFDARAEDDQSISLPCT